MTDVSLAERMLRVSEVIANKYRIEGVLGTGGMGVVFAATHLDLDRLVAVKVMRAEMIEYPSAVERLLLEAKLAARFKSEHVCKVLDVGTMPDGVPYIVMEYLDGADLATLLVRNGRFEIETAVDYMLEACEGLAEAHAASIIHRDLKPENLFAANNVDGSVTIKVLDFGISKQVGLLSNSRALTNPSAALGSPFYMAPEQMRSAKDVDTRTDVWAIGAILFELLTGRPVFEGDTLPEVCAAVLGDAPKRANELRADVPEALADAIGRCLEKVPSQRFTNVSDLALAIAPFGSQRATASLVRIRRLVGNLPSLAAGARTLPAVVSAAPLPPKAAVTTRDDLSPKSPAPSEYPGTARGRSLPWFGALAASALAIVAAGVLTRTSPPEPAATAKKPVGEAPAAAVRTAPGISSPSPKEHLPAEPIAPLFEKHDAEPGPTLPVKRERTPSNARAAKRPVKGHPSPTVVPSQLPAVAPSPSASAKHKATEAWNPESFGPRR